MGDILKKYGKYRLKKVPAEPTQNDINEKYLTQKRGKGLASIFMGGPDLLNNVLNTVSEDIGYFTGGAKGADAAPQLGMPSENLADLFRSFTGAPPDIEDSRVSPETQKRGANLEALIGMIPTPGDAAELAGKAAPAILHAVPNLFRKPALEDAAKNVNPDEIWRRWQWEQNPQGDWRTETASMPKLKAGVEFGSGRAENPLQSDFGPKDPALYDKAQTSLFRPSEAPIRPMPLNRRLPMRKTPGESGDRRYQTKYRWEHPTVGSLTENPTLYDQPGLDFLRGIKLNYTSGSLGEGVGGLYRKPEKYLPEKIEVTSAQNDPLQLLQHEIGHAVANAQDRPPGYSPKNAGAGDIGAKVRTQMEADHDAYEAAFNKRTADYWRREDEMFDKYGDFKPGDYDETTGELIRSKRPDYMTLTEFKEQWGKEHPELQALLDRTKSTDWLRDKDDPNLAYWTQMGEVEARNEAMRDRISTQEGGPKRLYEQRPAVTEDVPRKFQWTMDSPPEDQPSLVAALLKALGRTP